MAIEKNKQGTLSLNIQHDYITLRTPNGNFTTSYGGAKASGRLAVGSIFKELDNFVQNFKGSKGDAMRALMCEEKLASFWPEWNKKYEIDLKIGDTVSVDSMPKYQNGKIEKINKKTVTARFGKDLISVPFEMIKLS